MKPAGAPRGAAAVTDTGTEEGQAMFKRRWLMIAALVAPMLNAAEFSGKFLGLDDTMVNLNGRTYPVGMDLSAVYRGQFEPLHRIPPGTHVTYELDNVDGVTTVVKLIITDSSPELDRLFPLQ
jgi:hypothetical protein